MGWPMLGIFVGVQALACFPQPSGCFIHHKSGGSQSLP
jgi:hypothetical protein